MPEREQPARMTTAAIRIPNAAVGLPWPLENSAQNLMAAYHSRNAVPSQVLTRNHHPAISTSLPNRWLPFCAPPRSDREFARLRDVAMDRGAIAARSRKRPLGERVAQSMNE